MIRNLVLACLLSLSLTSQAASVTARVVADDFFKVFVGDEGASALTQVGGSGDLLWPSQGAPFNFELNEGQYIYVAAWDSAVYGPPHMWVGEFDVGSTVLLSNTTDWVSKFSPSIKDPTTSEVQALAQSASSWDSPQVSVPNGSYPYGSLIGGSPASFVWTDTFDGSSASEQGFVLFRTAVGLNPIPEPETYAMLLAGLGILSFTARRRKNPEASNIVNA